MSKSKQEVESAVEVTVNYTTEGLPIWKNEDGTLNTQVRKVNFFENVPADDSKKRQVHRKEYYLYMYNYKLFRAAEFEAKVTECNSAAEAFKGLYEDVGTKKSKKQIAETKLERLLKQQESLQKQLAAMAADGSESEEVLQ